MCFVDRQIPHKSLEYAASLNKAQSMQAKVENYDKSWIPHTTTSASKGSIERAKFLVAIKRTFLSNIFSTATVCPERMSMIERRCSISLKYLHCSLVAYDLTTWFDTFVTAILHLQHIYSYTLWFSLTEEVVRRLADT